MIMTLNKIRTLSLFLLFFAAFSVYGENRGGADCPVARMTVNGNSTASDTIVTCITDSVTFINTSIEDPGNLATNVDLFRYKFNDGTADATFTDSADVIKHLFEQTGNITVQLVVYKSAGAGCYDTTTRVIKVMPALTITSLEADREVCLDDSNGVVRVGLGTGAAPFDYLWSTQSNYSDTVQIDSNQTAVRDTADSLAPALYYLRVIDSSGMCSYDSSVTVAAGNRLGANFTVTTPINCAGDSSGVVQIALTNTQGDSAQFAWDTVALGNGLHDTSGSVLQTNSLSGMWADTYFVTATDSAGCRLDTSYILTGASNIVTVDSVGIALSCFGDTTGQVAVRVDAAGGGDAPFTYKWNTSMAFGSPLRNVTKASNIDLFSGVGANTYYVEITDNNGCTSYDTVVITEPAEIATTTLVETAIACGGSTGTVRVRIDSGGVANFKYDWSTDGSFPLPLDSTVTKADTFSLHTGLTAGTYYVRITDNGGAGCVALDTITLVDGASMTTSIDTIQNIFCQDSLATFAVDVAAGTANYRYQWYMNALGDSLIHDTTHASASDTLFNMAAGTYYLSVTDGNTCTVTETVTFLDGYLMTLGTSVTNTLDCAGDTNGVVKLEVLTNGVANFTYDWDTIANGPTPERTITKASTEDDFAGLAADTYFVTVTDANGCSLDTFIVLGEPDSLLADSLRADTALCGDVNDGLVFIRTVGGTANFTYEWSSSDGGAVEETDGPTAGRTATYEDLAGGTYFVTVTDGNGCTYDTSMTVIQNTILTVTDSVVNATCGQDDGEAYVFATGGVGDSVLHFTYEWPDSTVQTGLVGITGLGVGPYTVTITDSVGCQTTHTATVANDNAPSIDSLTIDSVTCFAGSDGQIEIETVTGGVGSIVYAVNDTSSWVGTTTFAGLSAGANVLVYAKDDNNCIDIVDTIVPQPDSMMIYLSADRSSCANSDATVTVDSVTGGNAPYTYAWSSGAGNVTSITNVAANTYTVTVTDNEGCPPVSDNITVLQDSSWVIVPSDSVGIIGDATPCVGVNERYDIDALALAGMGAGIVSYTWITPTGATLLGLGTSSGDDFTFDEWGWADTLKIAVMNACDSEDTISLRVVTPDSILIDFADSLVSCNGTDGKLFVTNATTGGTQPYTFAWNIPGETEDSIVDVAAGFYTVTVTDAELCEMVGTGEVETDTLNIDVPGSAEIFGQRRICPGVPYNYTLREIDSVRTYTWFSDHVSYTFNSANGDTAMSITFNPDMVDSTFIRITVENACGAADSTTLSKFVFKVDSIQFDLEADSSSCADTDGRVLVTNISGGFDNAPYSFVWSDTDTQTDTIDTEQIYDSIGADMYYVTVNDTMGCYNIMDSIELFENPNIQLPNGYAIQYNAGDDSVCVGEELDYWVDSIRLVNSYVWSSPSFGTVIDTPGTDTLKRVLFASYAEGLAGQLSVTIENQCNSDTVLSVVLFVDTPANMTFIDWPNGVLCSGDPNSQNIDLIRVNSHPNEVSYDWTLFAGVDSINNDFNGAQITIDYEDATGTGPITVRCRTRYCGLSDPETQLLSIAQTPDASFTMGDTIFCEQRVLDQDVALIPQPANSTNQIWSVIGDNAGDVIQNPSNGSITAVSVLPAYFQLVHDVVDNTCIGTAFRNIAILPMDNPDFDYTKDSYCQGDDILVDVGSLTNTATGGTYWFLPSTQFPDQSVQTDFIGAATINTTTGEVIDAEATLYNILYKTPALPALDIDGPIYGCQDSSVVSFTVDRSLNADSFSYQVPLCAADSIVLVYEGDVSTLDSLFWTINGEEVGLDIEDTIYTVPTNQAGVNTIFLTTKDQSTCVSVGESFNVQIRPNDGLPISILDSILGCRDYATTFARLPISYAFDSIVWDLGDTTIVRTTDETFEHTYSYPTEKTVHATVYSKLCYGSDTILVETPEVRIDTINDKTVYKGSSVFLETRLLSPVLPSDGFDHVWTPATDLDGNGNQVSPLVSPTETRDYKVVVTDPETGCMDSTEFKIIYEETQDFWIPTTFSPNGDGKNDIFRFFGVGVCGEMTMRIFNRWGEKIKTIVADGTHTGWDGKSESGVDQPIDTYVYILDFEYCDGNKEPEPIRGTITLIR